MPSLEVCLPCMLDRWPHLDVNYYRINMHMARWPCPARYTDAKTGHITVAQRPPRGCYKMLEQAIDATISEKTDA